MWMHGSLNLTLKVCSIVAIVALVLLALAWGFDQAAGQPIDVQRAPKATATSTTWDMWNWPTDTPLPGIFLTATAEAVPSPVPCEPPEWPTPESGYPARTSTATPLPYP